MPIVGGARLSHPYTQVSPGLFSLEPKGDAGSEAEEYVLAVLDQLGSLDLIEVECAVLVKLLM
jgi:hypothetical protein